MGKSPKWSSNFDYKPSHQVEGDLPSVRRNKGRQICVFESMSTEKRSYKELPTIGVDKGTPKFMH